MAGKYVRLCPATYSVTTELLFYSPVLVELLFVAVILPKTAVVLAAKTNRRLVMRARLLATTQLIIRLIS